MSTDWVCTVTMSCDLNVWPTRKVAPSLLRWVGFYRSANEYGDNTKLYPAHEEGQTVLYS